MKEIAEQVIRDLWPVVKKPLLISFIAFLGIIIMIPIFTYVYFARSLQSKEAIMNQNNSGITLLDRNDKPFFTFYEAKQKKIIPLEQIPTQLQQAVIASEDKEFYSHRGFSIKGIARALFADVKSQGIKQGGSTITQQLVKNALLNQKRSFLRKYQELVLAQEIERRYSKSEILEMYLNSVYFGEGAFGAQQAALTYFNKDAKDLTLAESSFLVGLLPAPSALSPFSGDADQAKKRQIIVLGEMVEQKSITSQQKDQAAAQKLVFNKSDNQELNVTAPHFALMVKQELIDKYGEEYVTRSGFKVKTTLNLDWQEYAENVVKNQVAQLKYNRATNGATVAIDPSNGEVMALVGSADWSNEEFGKYNIITAERQPGSSFKPIVYAEAIQRHTITAATNLQDEPTTFPGGYKPKDYDGKYRGNVTARRALANSLNIPSVEVLQQLGVPTAIQAANRMGINSLKDPSNYGLSLVLGGGEVKPIELINAYAAFANGGMQYQPSMILEIKDKLDNVIFTVHHEPQRVASEEVSYIISSMLSDNNARQEVFGNALTISRQAAVKTGTTENYRDAWTIGYTPQIIVGVWVGNNDNAPMDNVAGSLGAAPIWRQLMERFLAGTPVVTFKKPLTIREVALCIVKTEKDGDKEKKTTSTYTEYFLPGTEPKDSCMTPTPDQSPTPAANTPTPTPQNTPTNTPEPSVTNTPAPSPTAILSPTVTIQVPSITPTPTH